jgi:hypothetical protein
MISTPNNPSEPNGITFEFQAIENENGLDVAGLLCRLDDATYTPCISPHTFSKLSEGQHTFYVRAMDVEGNVDETPASFTWTVNPEEQGSVIWLPLILKSGPYSDVVRNGSFESRQGWILQATDSPAIYSRSKTFSGEWSMRTGIENPNLNVHGYSGIWQQVILPRNIKSAVLSFWLHPFSTEDGSFNPTPFSLDPRQDNESITETGLESSSDTQWVLILDKHGDILDMLVEQRSNKGMWEQWVIDLTKYQGQTFRLYFGTFNNGDGGVTGMYVDDVSLKVYR